MRKLTALTLLIWASAASATDWTLVDQTDDVIFYADLDSIRRAGSYMALWRKVDHSRDKKVTYSEAKDLWYYDCVNQMQALKSSVNYNRDGTIYSSWTNKDYELRWVAIAPDTVGWSHFELVCK